MKKGLDFVLLFVVFVSVCGQDDDVTLTTAMVKAQTTPKPTAIYGRINIDRNVEERLHAPLDLFRLRASDIRRSHVNIWNWDYWCQLQPKTGNCTQSMTRKVVNILYEYSISVKTKPKGVWYRYYYDAQIDQCMSFTYSGCNGNKNKFDTLVDCERYCKGAAFMTIKEAAGPSYCSLQPNAGLCMAMFYKFYYDVNDERCKSFIYGGCGGNQNRFGTVNECMGRCHPDEGSEELAL